MSEAFPDEIFAGEILGERVVLQKQSKQQLILCLK